MAVAKNQVIIQELRQQFKDMDDSFLAPIKSYNDKVNNDVINFTEIGADPAVLIDNTTYPIAVNTRNDVGIPVSLHKMDTENTKVTDDEMFALAYDKKSSVRKQHVEALMRAYLKLGAHSLAPASNSSNTPVIQTTGTTVGTRKKLLPADLVTYKRLIDALEIPLESRYLILCSDHANDLLDVDQTFRDRFNSTASGKVITSIYGFQIFTSLHTPKFVGTTYAKKAFGAVAAATDIAASVFYSSVNNMKAIGSTGIYYRDAAQDPENRQSVFGARQFGIVHAVTAKGQGAITDAYVAP